jgi:hypothetical protein
MLLLHHLPLVVAVHAPALPAVDADERVAAPDALPAPGVKMSISDDTQVSRLKPGLKPRAADSPGTAHRQHTTQSA